jgi:hypothetical protein
MARSKTTSILRSRFRIPRSICCRYHQRGANQNHLCHQKDVEPVLERDLRHVCFCPSNAWITLTYHCRRATEDSILAIQIFDQKKFKKKDQGFLGVINVRIGDVIDLDVGGKGSATGVAVCLTSAHLIHRNAHPGSEEIQ